MADFRYGQDLVRALLREQHPDLADLPLHDVDGGWDNQQWRLGDNLAVRLPRTERAPTLLLVEQTWLPTLASSLPLPTPVPERIGVPSSRFEHTWTIPRWVHGTPADQSPIARLDAAAVLAGFLRSLHRDAPADAPLNPTRGMSLRTMQNDRVGMFDGIADHPGLDELRRIWGEAVAAPDWHGAPSWLHGDLHPANVIVRDDTLAGVIDFGDMCAGDPATDLSAAWILLPADAEGPFFDAYGRADDATVSRARGWAILRALGLIMIGRNGRLGLPGGKPTWEPAGYATLERLLSTTL